MEQKEISKNIKKTMNTAVDSIKASAKNVKLP